MKKLSLIVGLVLASLVSFSQAPGCPNIDAGPDQLLDCVPCTDLTATVLQTGATTTYTVTNIPYAPPYAFTGGTPTFVGTDDIWSGVINLPFDFCFYGNLYNQIVVGANGIITFDVTQAGQYCPWSFTASIPSSSLPVNSIFGAYHDIDPSIYGDINYAVLGAYPCRTFVVNYNNVAQFSCTSIATTQQIVIYESTNAIEVYIHDKPLCSTWNSGNACVGIQNSTGTVGLAPTGYNTGAWTANDIAWRFTPSGTPNFTVNWYDNLGTLIGTGLTVTVCPSATTTYTGEVVYDCCNGSTVTVTDDVVVTVTSTLSVDAGQDQTVCPGTTVTLGGSPTAGNGAAPYTYAWSPGTGLSSTTASNPDATVATTTTYTVTITDSGGCVVSDDVTITVTLPYVDSTTTTPEACGQGDGTITIVAAGGSGAPFTYAIPGSSNQTGIFTGLTAGPYTVTITDSGGCTITENVTVTGTGNVTSGFTASVDQCLNGNSFDFTNTGDTGGGITFSWSFQNGNPATSTLENPTGITWSTPGVYQITQTTAIGSCNDVSTTTIEVYAHPAGNASTIVNVTCNGLCDGSATANVSGGAPAYTYLWDANAGNQATQTASNLCAGTYSYVVSDANGCTGTGNGTVSENTAVVINNENSTPVTCSGMSDGTVSVSATGGCPPLNYSIGSASNTSGTFPGLPGGTYTVTVTDCNGCTDVSNPLTVGENQVISINSQGSTDVSCYGYDDGTITVTASGGTGALMYNLGTGAQGSGFFSNLNGGNYTVTITDQNGCSNSVSFSLSEPGPFILGLSPDQTICGGASATINASVAGGTPNYIYHWSPTGPGPATIIVTPATQTTYSCYAEDANGCNSNTESMTVTVSPPIQLSVSSNETHVCPGDPALITAQPSAGIGAPYTTYLDGIIANSPFIVYPFTTTTYTITAEDICGSTATQTITVNVYSLPPISFSSDTLQGCQPLTVHFVENSPDLGQTYVWNFGDNDNNNLSYQKYPTHEYEYAGVYDVMLTVTSVEGCVISDIIPDMITVWPRPTANFLADPEVVSVIKPMIFFHNHSLLADSCYWAFGDGDSSNAYNPFHVYPIYPTGTYNVELIVATEKGCRDTTFSTVEVKNEYTFYAPTAFSPDNDGNNDFFRIMGNGIDENNFSLIIYDRWGEVVFETTDPEEWWDGRIKDRHVGKNGVYTWLCVYKDVQGIEHQKAGAVTIIR
ncbi:MAG: PKD domain-containing protein [Bacteroidota bacterium]